MEAMIGVNIPGGTNLENLDRVLTRIEAEGWQAAELNLSACPLILGGQAQRQDCRQGSVSLIHTNTAPTPADRRRKGKNRAFRCEGG